LDTARYPDKSEWKNLYNFGRLGKTPKIAEFQLKMFLTISWAMIILLKEKKVNKLET
jgi:hypothetical protein